MPRLTHALSYATSRATYPKIFLGVYPSDNIALTIVLCPWYKQRLSFNQPNYARVAFLLDKIEVEGLYYIIFFQSEKVHHQKVGMPIEQEGKGGMDSAFSGRLILVLGSLSVVLML